MRVLDGDPRPPRQDVFQMQRALGDRGIRRFDPQVARRGGDRVEQVATSAASASTSLISDP